MKFTRAEYSMAQFHAATEHTGCACSRCTRFVLLGCKGKRPHYKPATFARESSRCTVCGNPGASPENDYTHRQCMGAGPRL